MSENDPYGSEGGARNDRPYPYRNIAATRLRSLSTAFNCTRVDKWTRQIAENAIILTAAFILAVPKEI